MKSFRNLCFFRKKNEIKLTAFPANELQQFLDFHKRKKLDLACLHCFFFIYFSTSVPSNS